MAMDLGKQIGPLPLGGWVAVVAIGGGIAWYARKQGNTSPLVVEDVSGTPGVGVGGSGAYVPVVPPTNAADAKPTNNEDWGIAMVQWMTAKGYDSATSELAVRKYLNQAKLSPQEWTLVTLGMAILGPPPQSLGYIPDDPTDAPTLLYYLEGSKPAVWALANGPSGKWVETNSQIQANAWAVTYADNKMATHVNTASWQQLKAQYGGAS